MLPKLLEEYWYIILLWYWHIVYHIDIAIILSSYNPSNLGTLILIDLRNLNNDVIRQLILGSGKLIGETSPMFWVDLAYMLCSRYTVSLQGFRGWLTFRIVHVVIDYLLVGPDSEPGDLVMILGMRNPPKI